MTKITLKVKKRTGENATVINIKILHGFNRLLPKNLALLCGFRLYYTDFKFMFINMYTKLASAIFVAVLCLETCTALVWTLNNYPSPMIYTNVSDPCDSISHWFCDPDAIISKYYEENIVSRLTKIRRYTKSPCSGNSYKGFSVGVAIANKIYKDGSSIKDRARRFAYHVREFTWGLPASPADCDDSVLLMLFVQERFVYISTGEKARVLLPDGAVNAIISTMRNDLAYDKFGSAMYKGTYHIYQYLSKSKVYKASQFLLLSTFFIK